MLVLAAFGGAWSNHFQNGFHLDDRSAIVSNPAIRTLSNIPKFFINPKLFSAKLDEAAYEPLVSTGFAVDYAMRGRTDPALFQLQNFWWFCISIGLFYVLLRLIPGGDHYSSLFGAALYGLHPLAAGTINQAAEFGTILGNAALMAGLLIVLVWPQRAPAQINLGAPRVPKGEWDLFLIRTQPRVTKVYQWLRRSRVAFYMIPVALGLLAFPGTAVFAPLLAVYLLLFEPEKGARRAWLAGAVCGGYWIAQEALVWRFGSNVRLPLLDFWVTQPLVALRSLYFFLVPVNLSPVSVLPPVSHFWAPAAIAGYVTVAVLIALALALGRKEEWRAVAFGIWWFLLALLPGGLIPGPAVETAPRMFFASAGLVLAVSRAALTVGSLYRESRWRVPLLGAGLLAGLAVLMLCAEQTYRLNDVWQSDETLWRDMVAKNPNDGRSLMRYGRTLLASEDADFFNIRLDMSYDYLKRAAARLPDDPEVLTSLALASQQEVREADAEKQFQRAIQNGPKYAPAYAYYGHMLLAHQKLKEAMAMEQKALQLDPSSLEAWQTMADAYIAQPNWKGAIDAANRILAIDPDNVDGQRSLDVAEAGLASRDHAEETVKEAPTVENYLALSVVYFNEKRYQDTIRVCQQALKLNPNVAEAYVNMATAYHALHMPDEGIAALREAERLRPDLSFIKSNIDWELAHKGQPPEADGN